MVAESRNLLARIVPGLLALAGVVAVLSWFDMELKWWWHRAMRTNANFSERQVRRFYRHWILG